MKKNPNLTRSSSDVSRLLADAVKNIVSSMPEFKSCVRAVKARVVTPPNGKTCAVQLVGDDTVITLPYSSKVANVLKDDIVWVASLQGSMRNAIVWETSDFK